MTTSADVASHAGLSRSTVSQIFNGREHLFSEDTIARVRASASELGYRPSLAGRTLARGRSDIVITLLSDVTFNPRLRELVDTMTAELAIAGLTNLVRFMGSDGLLEDAVLGLKPYGVISLASLSEAQNERLLGQGVRLVSQSEDIQIGIDNAIGRLQAQHLAECGFDTVAVVVPEAAREQGFASAREAGVHEWATEHGLTVLPTRHVSLERGGSHNAVHGLPSTPIGLAAYNDEVAMSVLSAALFFGRTVPNDLGIIGIDNSPVAAAMTPTITTIDYDIDFSAHGIVALLMRDSSVADVDDPVEMIRDRLRVIQGDTTRR
ncbi:LacI family DNA-binding transcriptional regulator [Microbacterium sp. Mcb102]|uniref:LacI family DNA-binding transcriptional regulator n=1 Tax=Microbacterium sp. Mcb102 TaxID=2926012 RepID=UPI0021C827E4|nr:LacI family DNA-binding transcriptional regulator [Microbacterium sp. Mcb102]